MCACVWCRPGGLPAQQWSHALMHLVARQPCWQGMGTPPPAAGSHGGGGGCSGGGCAVLHTRGGAAHSCCCWCGAMGPRLARCQPGWRRATCALLCLDLRTQHGVGRLLRGPAGGSQHMQCSQCSPPLRWPLVAATDSRCRQPGGKDHKGMWCTPQPHSPALGQSLTSMYSCWSCSTSAVTMPVTQQKGVTVWLSPGSWKLSTGGGGRPAGRDMGGAAAATEPPVAWNWFRACVACAAAWADLVGST